MHAYLLLMYAIVSIALLWSYDRTRLFPLYLLKCAWTFFTIMAFAWVLSMSLANDDEYLSHPSGPFAILIGEPVQNAAGLTIMQGGYPAALRQFTGTEPAWVVAALLCMWMTWGLTLPSRLAKLRPQARTDGSSLASESDWRHRLVPLQWPIVLSMAIAGGLHVRETGCFALVMLLWIGAAFARARPFARWGGWMLGAALLVAALPLIGPLRDFDWSRYRHGAANYSNAWIGGNIGQYFINSMMVTMTTVALTTLLGCMAAYVLARRPLRGRSLVFGGIITSIAVPGILIQVPLFLLIKDWSFKIYGPFRFAFMDSRFGLSMIYTALSLPFTIYVLTGFFRTLPGELGEASVIDGCSPWKTFTQVYLPLALPGIATTGIFNFLGAWNEFNLGMIFMSNPNFKTLPIGLYELQAATQYTSAWATLFAGIVLLSLPTFLIFVFLQQRIVAGLSAGALKG